MGWGFGVAGFVVQFPEYAVQVNGPGRRQGVQGAVLTAVELGGRGVVDGAVFGQRGFDVLADAAIVVGFIRRQRLVLDGLIPPSG